MREWCKGLLLGVVGDEEKLFANGLISRFGQADLESLDWTKQAIIRHAQSLVGEDIWDNPCFAEMKPLSLKVEISR